MLDKQEAVGSAKPTDRPKHDVDDPIYLMRLTIPQLFLKPLQVMWYAFADWCGIQTAYNQSVEKFFWVGARKRNKTIVVEEYVVSSSMDYLKHKK